MCEEPDYRLLVVHRMPTLKVLDQHVISALERRKAAGAIGGDVATLTVAFGKRVPPYDPAWDEQVPDRSRLEQDMSKVGTEVEKNLKCGCAEHVEIDVFQDDDDKLTDRSKTCRRRHGGEGVKAAHNETLRN